LGGPVTADRVAVGRNSLRKQVVAAGTLSSLTLSLTRSLAGSFGVTELHKP